MSNWMKFRNDIAKARFDEAKAVAEGHEHLKPSWEQCLTSLKNVAANYKGEVEFVKDLAPLSLTWGIIREDGSCPLNGGMIFHGPHDGFGSGSVPTFSVSLSSEHGWQLHT